MVNRRLHVVLDTNQWDAHTLLRSHLSASLIFLVEQHDGRIVVPGVVRQEVVAHLAAAYASALAEIRSSLSRVRMILGHAPDPDFAPEGAVETALDERLDELGPLVEVGDVAGRHHAEAGQMVLAGLAPNSKGVNSSKIACCGEQSSTSFREVTSCWSLATTGSMQLRIPRTCIRTSDPNFRQDALSSCVAPCKGPCHIYSSVLRPWIWSL